jgi:hypothetical protein
MHSTNSTILAHFKDHYSILPLNSLTNNPLCHAKQFIVRDAHNEGTKELISPLGINSRNDKRGDGGGQIWKFSLELII